MVPGLRVERYEMLGSTNSVAFEQVRAGDPGHLWVVARQQTLGRGRRGRDWSSPIGNLYASYVMTVDGVLSRLGEVPLLTAVAVSEAIDSCTGAYQLAKVKWPNDLLVDGAKISGILLEAEKLDEGKTCLVIGCGVNCVSHPRQSLYPCTDLAVLGFQVTAEQLFDALARSLDSWLKRWQQSNGFAEVRKAWLARAAFLGKTIKVRNGDSIVSGTFLDLNESGHLVLGLPNGKRETSYAGDVFLEGSQPDGSPDTSDL